MYFHKLAGLPRVLCRDHICGAQDIQRPQRDVIRMADGRGNQIEAGRERHERLAFGQVSLLGPGRAVVCAEPMPHHKGPVLRRDEMVLFSHARRAVLALALCALAACAAPIRTDSPPARDNAGPVKVALLVPLGSGDSEREALADSLVQAARLAMADLRGVNIDLTVYPTAGTASRAASAAREAADAGTDVILGPLFSGATAAVAPIAEAEGIRVLSLSNNAAVAGGPVFVLGTTFDTVAQRVIGYSVGEGQTQIGIVHPRGAEGILARDAVRRATQRFGGTVVAEGSYPLSVEGITAEVPSLARQLRGAGARTVVLTDGPTAGLTFTAETLRGLGLRKGAVQFVGLQRWDTSRQAMAQPSLEGGWFAAPDPKLGQAFADRYVSATGSAPSPLSGLAYDGIAAIGALVAEAREDGRGDPFSAARLTKPAGFAGVLGVFRFTADGQNERALAIFTVEEGTARQISPAPRRFNARGS